MSHYQRNLTLEGKERIAYITGDTHLVEVLAGVADSVPLQDICDQHGIYDLEGWISERKGLEDDLGIAESEIDDLKARIEELEQELIEEPRDD